MQTLSPGGDLKQDQVQRMGEEFGLSEINEGDYSHLHYFTPANMEAPPGQSSPSGRGRHAEVVNTDATGSTALSPLHQGAVLSLAPADQCVEVSEVTPGSYGEVPDFVLVRLRDEDNQADVGDISGLRPLKRSRSSARVCLETRLSAVSADHQGHGDGPSAAGLDLLKILQQFGGGDEEVLAHPHAQRQMRSDGANPVEGSSLDVSALCDQVIGQIPHAVELNIHLDDVVAADGSNKPVHESSAKQRASSYTSLTRRRERHNMMERERRKKIRMYCDQLNTLVPFCKSSTDRATTLQLTTAFLMYINKTYGNTIQKRFLQSLSDFKEL